jgi:hypothetical protein
MLVSLTSRFARKRGGGVLDRNVMGLRLKRLYLGSSEVGRVQNDSAAIYACKMSLRYLSDASSINFERQQQLIALLGAGSKAKTCGVKGKHKGRVASMQTKCRE